MRIGAWPFTAAEAWFRDIPADAAARIVGSRLPPTHVIAGSDDILAGVEPVRGYAKVLNATITMIEGCGHYPWIERPDEFRSALSEWLTHSFR